jgi:hypothetical protein
MIKRASVTVFCISLVLAVPAAAGSGRVKFFTYANGKISCQLSSGGTLGALAYCQTLKPASSVTLHKNGFAKICKGAACLGNPPENATVLKKGKSEKVGPFFCETITGGVECIVVPAGKGFDVTGAGIKKVTVRES